MHNNPLLIIVKTFDIGTHIPKCFIDSQMYYILVVDEIGHFVYANPLFQTRCDELKLDVERDIITAFYVENIKKCVNTQKTIQINTQNLQIAWELTPIFDEKNEMFVVLCIGNDTTKVDKLEHTMNNILNTVNVVVDNITDGFYMLNADWEFIKVNRVAEKVLGKSSQDLLGKTLWEAFPEVVGAKMDTFYKEAMSNQTTKSFEVYHPLLQQHYEIIAYPSQEGLAVFFKNITERKWVEEQLQYSESKLRAMLDSSTDANILISPTYKILSVNKVAERAMSILQKKEIREGDNMWDFVVEGTEEGFKENFEKCLQGQVVSSEREFTFSNGQKRWFKSTYYPVYDRENNLIGVSFNSKDIDNEKRTEQAVKDSQQKLNAIYNSQLDSYVLLDENAIVLSFNKMAHQMFYDIFEKDIKVGESFTPFISGEDFFQNMQDAFDGKAVEVQRKFWIKKYQKNVWYVKKHVPVYDENGSIVGISLNYVDITKLKEHEEKIETQNEILRKIAWQQSHQVRRPLANILGLSSLMQEAFSHNEPTAMKEYMNYLIQSSEELDKIIHEIVHTSNYATDEEDEPVA